MSTPPFRTIPQVVVDAAERHGRRTWMRTDRLSLTFEDAARWVGRSASALTASGVRRDDVVLLTARNTPEHLVCWLALCSIGAITALADPRSTRQELAGLLRQTEPRAVLTDADLRPEVSVATGTAGLRAQQLDVGEITGAPPVDGGPGGPPLDVGHDAVAALIPTSGTTGRSKLVMQTHRAYTMAGEGFPSWMELTSTDVLMTSLPLFHINAPAYSVMGSLCCGAGLVLLPRFSASGFLDAARRHGATEFNAIGAMLEILMREPERPDDADTPLRLCYTGPSPPRERQEEIERRLGLRIVCGYGLSESPYGLIWPRGARPFGTLGAPRQHPLLGTVNEARVVDEQGSDVPAGATGELLLRNPTITPGYWGMPEETARTVVDGWLHTGDLVTAGDDGMVTFVGRRKEVIRRRGENLSPLEVEAVIESHPDVLECAVVGVPSEMTEEEVKAFVVPARGATLDVEALRDHAAAALTAYKVPRFWHVVESLPRTATGRVAKHRLPADRAGEVDLGGMRRRPDGARVPPGSR